ncbi:MAG: tRNA (adenosine(37)-N6)-threonylcarbamoyltransferase complex ATPase subunit type 1 TsaE [Pyrinomonadaceae bacterium]|nr:tRNA (adenosine(37)-N6)-threonylcarbamoyltransferase complex ATPase subunit type 1 TsaE [Pyrinomonadaceae bacterium]
MTSETSDSSQDSHGAKDSPRVWLSNAPEETFNYGRSFGAQLKGGEIVLLNGGLGAGKTTFTKGVASALRIEPEEVTSPTFTLVNNYQGRLNFYHIDLYRLEEGFAAAHAVDIEELLADESGVIIIEWAERMGDYPLPAPVWRVLFEEDGDDARRITVEEIKR